MKLRILHSLTLNQIVKELRNFASFYNFANFQYQHKHNSAKSGRPIVAIMQGGEIVAILPTCRDNAWLSRYCRVVEINQEPELAASPGRRSGWCKFARRDIFMTANFSWDQ